VLKALLVALLSLKRKPPRQTLDLPPLLRFLVVQAGAWWLCCGGLKEDWTRHTFLILVWFLFFFKVFQPKTLPTSSAFPTLAILSYTQKRAKSLET